MNEPFDPYRRWLGIRDADRPPNHYRLLGLELFEEDAAVIQSSADRQMGHLRTFQTGQHSSLSQRILNEVATAKVCLLNAKQKAAYDARLRVALGLVAPAAAPVQVAAAPVPVKAPAGLAPKPPSAFAAAPKPTPAAAAPEVPQSAGPSFTSIGEPLTGGIDGHEEYQRLSSGRTLWPALMAGWCAMLISIIVVWAFFWPDRPEPGEVRVERRILIREKPKTEKPAKAAPVQVGPPALEELRPIGEHKTGVWAIAFSPDGAKLATATTDRGVRIWDAKDGTQLLETVAEDLIHGLAWSPDGSAVAFTGVDGVCWWWDTAEEGPKEAFKQQDEALCVAISPDGTLVASGGKDGTLLVHRTPEFPRVHRLDAHSGPIHALAFSPDGRFLATASGDGTVRTWDMETGERGHSLEIGGPATAVAWSRLAELRPEAGGAVTLSRDGGTIVTGTRDGKVQLWEAKSGKAGIALDGHSEMIRAIVIAPDSRRAVTAGADRSIRVWDLKTGDELSRGVDHKAAIFGLSLAKSGRLASGSADATVRTWKLPEVPAPSPPAK